MVATRHHNNELLTQNGNTHIMNPHITYALIPTQHTISSHIPSHHIHIHTLLLLIIRVVWANSELDGLCFGKGMSGTQLDKPSKALDTLEKLLSSSDFLVNNQFSVADVAIASYLNYVPVFFGNVRKLPNRPSIAKYMVNCANRPAFAKAFGDDHARLVSQKVPTWV